MEEINVNFPSKINRRTAVRMLLSFFSVILPLIIVMAATFFIFYTNSTQRTKVSEKETSEGEEVMTPQMVLADRYRYKDKNLTIKGRIVLAPVTCPESDCPTSDRCCGCPAGRDILITDANTLINQKTDLQLKLLDPEKKSFCQRKTGTCQYFCTGWQTGAVYEINGTYFAEPPDKGSSWKLFTDSYFMVDNQRLIGKPTVFNQIKIIFNDIWQKIQKLKSGGYIYLQ